MEDRFGFRAWDKHEKDMIDVSGWAIDSNGLKINGYYNDLGYNFEDLEESRFVLMQCTGLKDKNGKLIYEGDILRDFYNGHTGPVEWDADYAKFIVAHRKLVVWAFDEGYCTEAWEIIGTIYENPELLESKR